MSNILAVFFVLFFFTIKSQINIVPNGDFELNSGCPNFSAQWNFCIGWNNISYTTGCCGNWGTPDYFHTCATNGYAPPAMNAGTCTPNSGNAMMGLVLYNVPYPEQREYISRQMSASMIPGSNYTVSFWITNGTGIKSPWTIKNIGIHFSSNPLTQNGWNIINVIPQCEITTNVASTTWTKYTFTINPTNTWNYLTIGNFRSDSANSPVMFFPNPGGNYSVYANYFFDDIEVLSPLSTDIGAATLISQNLPFKLYPNPIKDQLNIEYQGSEINEIRCCIYNCFGQEVYFKNLFLASNGINFPNTEIDLSSFRSGIYLIKLENNSDAQILKVIKD